MNSVLSKELSGGTKPPAEKLLGMREAMNPKTFRWKHEAIELFKDESASSVYSTIIRGMTSQL
jgi:hypothetical protein